MDYETFKQEMTEDLKQRLYERGIEDVEMSFHNVEKANQHYESLTVRQEGSNVGVKACKDYRSGTVKVTGQDLYNLQPNNTNNNNTEYSDTYPILSGDEERMGHEAYLREQLEISVLKSRYPYDSDMIEGILELMLDILCSRRKMIRIAGDDKPANVVKGRFMKLNMGHIEYVMDCVRENTTKVRSIKQYLLAALYNAPATMDGYYRAEVNHDMATGKI